MVKYKNRVVDAILADKLSYMGAVWVRGPKWCGKIELMERYAFYERAKKAYAIVLTGETRKYGNVILKKGVTPLN